jgi:hypothetical protein
MSSKSHEYNEMNENTYNDQPIAMNKRNHNTYNERLNNITDQDSNDVNKKLLTFIYCLTFWNFGICVALFGPTLLDLGLFLIKFLLSLYSYILIFISSMPNFKHFECNVSTLFYAKFDITYWSFYEWYYIKKKR